MSWYSILSAYLFGLVGSVHCVFMCGGFASIMLLGGGSRAQPAHSGEGSTAPRHPDRQRYSPGRAMVRIGIVNLGRATTYALLGIAAGGVGALALGAARSGALENAALATSRGLSAITFLIVGLALLVYRNPPEWLSKFGQRLWARVQPLSRKALPLDQPRRLFVFGMIWGLLPCGFVYAALGFAVASGTPIAGAMTMGAFALGTLPALVLTAFAGQQLFSQTAAVTLQRVVGAGMAGFGALALFGA
jgi:sulfite exporter TauE/SafE